MILIKLDESKIISADELNSIQLIENRLIIDTDNERLEFSEDKFASILSQFPKFALGFTELAKFHHSKIQLIKNFPYTIPISKTRIIFTRKTKVIDNLLTLGKEVINL